MRPKQVKFCCAILFLIELIFLKGRMWLETESKLGRLPLIKDSKTTNYGVAKASFNLALLCVRDCDFYHGDEQLEANTQIFSFDENYSMS